MFFIPNGITSKAELRPTNTLYLIASDVFLNRLFTGGTLSGEFLNPKLIVFL